MKPAERPIRKPLSDLAGARFDVAVIGAGINGASAAQYLSAAGYGVLLVDKGDFAGGATSRSGRVLHCGLSSFTRFERAWDAVKRPDMFLLACRRAQQLMQGRSQFVNSTPERVHPTTYFHPVYSRGSHALWQVKAAFLILRALGPKDVPLDVTYLKRSDIPDTPLVNRLRDPQDIRGVVSFTEFVLDWPERIAVDEILDAERMGAVVRNYTEVAAVERAADGNWRLRLRDTLGEDGSVEVGARVVLNVAGPWVDRVNRSVPAKPARKVKGVKGVYIVVRLADDCRGFGISALDRDNRPFYFRPWHDLHYIGLRESVFDGDVDDVRPTDDDIAWLVAEANHAMQGLKLTRDDVLYAWAGVQPHTFDARFPKGKRSTEIHDLGGEGLSNMLALTAGPLVTHRAAGQKLCAAVGKRIAPSRSVQVPSFKGRRFGGGGANALPLLDDHPSVTIGDLVESAKYEHVVSLVDLLFRRVDVGWTATMGRGAARRAAEAVADVTGWDAARIDREVAEYVAYIDKTHRAKGSVE